MWNSTIFRFLYEHSLHYCTINTIRSAVSMTHNYIENTPIGQHSCVKADEGYLQFKTPIFNHMGCDNYVELAEGARKQRDVLEGVVREAGFVDGSS